MKKKGNLFMIAALVLSASLTLALPVAASTGVGFNIDCTAASGFGTVPAHDTYSWVVHFYDPRTGTVVTQGSVSGGDSGAPFNPVTPWPVPPSEGTSMDDSYYWWWVWDGPVPWSDPLLAQGEGHFSCEPPPPAQGCTPGYWKQAQHFDSWPAAYTPGTPFESVFGRDVPGTPTLLEALKLGGGGLNALMRHAAAALLNSVSVNYGMTTAQVITAFQDAFDSGNYEPTKDMFDALNNAGCPLN